MKRRHRMFAAIVAVAAVAVAAVLLRAMLPHWITDELNRRMAEMGAYRGHISSVDLHLYRGAYQVHDLRIEKRNGEVVAPLLEVPRLDLSVRWRDLFRGALVGEAVFHRPQLNFVDGRVEQEDQSGRGVDWRTRLESLFPLRLDRVSVYDGTVVFHNPFTQPRVQIRAVDLWAEATNLTNVRDAQGRRVANVHARARALGHAPMEVAARFDPLGGLEDFSVDARITGVELTRLNDLMRAYAALDVASGQGDLVIELDASDGRLRGYAKPLLNELEIFDWEQDVEQHGDNPFVLLWEGLAELVSELFSNQPKDRFATRIPIDGSTDEPGTSTLDAILGILRNAFVQAYEAHFEGAEPSSD